MQARAARGGSDRRRPSRSSEFTGASLTSTGNAAKDYCLAKVAALARERELTVADLGCGDGRNVEALLRAFPSIDYVGIDPSRAALDRARERLDGLRVELVHGPAYDVRLRTADVVLSFSVLEHVVRRDAYLRSIALNLAPGGIAFVNYDSGHFAAPSEWWKGPIRQLLARVGSESRYQSPVSESAFAALIAAAGLVVDEAKSFNTHLKEIFRSVPEQSRERFAEAWLQLELTLNELLEYRDELAPLIRTRNFVLRLPSG